MSKARYYLEQTVPELEDLQNKGLFTKQEITQIMRRRTDFEHRLNSRGSKVRDYLQYVEFESNLEKLRKKRYTRLSKVGLINTKPSISDWANERRILFIYDRSIQKFPNDFLLWENYLNFAKKQKLFKKIYKIYNQLLQLHPTHVPSWLNAAQFEYEVIGSAKNARILFQRALRFNKDSKKLWLNYTIFELSYITKLLNRRKILGLVTESQQIEHENSEKKAQDLNDDLIELPKITNDEIKDQLNHLPDVDLNMLGNADTNPALRGDVSLTIFDVCIETLWNFKKSNPMIKEFEFKFQISLDFLNIFDKFPDLDRSYLNNHIIQYLIINFSHEVKTTYLDIIITLRNLSIEDPEFIEYLQFSVKKYLAYKKKSNFSDDQLNELKNLVSQFLVTEYLQHDSIDEKTKSILNSIIKKL
ncbi:hypothetical protein WICMUC_003898 [Wickerhamomyces mucosus]|uniref:U3 small nucleolar RNA-associated protein 6 N-terminal domain-containing protein n=1 Tax=Wickerhamomyces mucosus TaxID=1378264 RepID=A0A9P8PK50_9ASCO|nr:hypothetical protein WICMUC_003898 [Wickerhamomyces mucosus]